MSKKKNAKPKHHSPNRHAVLPEDTVELHLPTALYARIVGSPALPGMKDEDQKDLLKVLFHCSHKNAAIFGVNKVNLVEAKVRKDDADDNEPFKLCTGP